jgi:hypothetical protein
MIDAFLQPRIITWLTGLRLGRSQLLILKYRRRLSRIAGSRSSEIRKRASMNLFNTRIIGQLCTSLACPLTPRTGLALIKFAAYRSPRKSEGQPPPLAETVLLFEGYARTRVSSMPLSWGPAALDRIWPRARPRLPIIPGSRTFDGRRWCPQRVFAVLRVLVRKDLRPSVHAENAMIQKEGQAPRRDALFPGLASIGSEPVPIFEPCPENGGMGAQAFMCNPMCSPPRGGEGLGGGMHHKMHEPHNLHGATTCLIIVFFIAPPPQPSPILKGEGVLLLTA